MLNVCLVFCCLILFKLKTLLVAFVGIDDVGVLFWICNSMPLFGAIAGVCMSMYSRRMHVFIMGDSKSCFYIGDCKFDGLMRGPQCCIIICFGGFHLHEMNG